MVTTRVKKERVSYSTSTSAASSSTSTAPKKEKKPAKKAPKSATKAPAKKKTKKDFGGAGKDMRSKRQKEKQKKLLDEIAASQNLGDAKANFRAQAIAAKGGYSVNGVVLGNGVVPFEAGGTRYVIEAAKSGRSTCAKSFRGIPKGALRWTCYQNGVQRGGWTLLEFVTPKMLHNAIVAHKSIDKIHGFEAVSGQQAIDVIEILRNIARTGGNAPKGKRGKKGKKAKKKGKKTAEEVEEDVDDGVLEMAILTLDERLEQALQAAKQAGDVLMIDCSDDEEDAAPPPKEVVMEKVPVPVTTVEDDEDDYDEDSDDDDDDDDGDDGVNAAEHPDRDPEAGDTIFMTWDSDPTEYLCVVHNSEDKKNALVVASADAKFTETLDFDPASDMWRFSEGNVKTISDKARSKGKAKVAANPNIVKAVASKTVSESAKASKSLDGLRFVITGITQEQGTEFGDCCTAIILSCGGRVTGGVSGATDYLVAGDIHYNPFLKTTGPIEGGSKYKKAITSDRCKIIGLEDLMELANGEDV
ncbi:hypothetical protein TrCOL_g5015 [Triparma columacea]|uniref:PARP-type domain-containing protein n=1 Tax=Triparma columacea TaxID=722753 RepID=A0A9W7FW55_9STRA|nr:hypothetical protein TrCOL_g5015 [Triparma columacea]